MATKPFLSQIAVPVGTTTGDVYYPQTSLLMHFNGTNGSTTMTDNSKNNFVLTAINGASLSSVQSKFGGTSLALDGTNDYVSISGNNILDFASSDFTVECWVRLNAMPTSDAWPTNYSSHFIVITIGTPSLGDGIGFMIGQTKLIIQNNDSQSVNGTHGMTTNTWYHLAFVRYSNNLYLYVDGVQKGTAAYSSAVGTGATTYIGCETGQGAFLNGYIDDLRVTKGIARYTSNFTPSTTQFLDSTGDANSNVVVNSTATGFAIGTGGINGAQLAKAWVNFNGTGTVAIRDSYNVSSITDNGTGDYTINYGTALNNSNYAISGITDYNESGLHRVIVYRSGLSHQYNTLGVRIQIIAQVGSSDATQDPAFASLMVLGN
jgi:hypothetical protein